MVTRVGIRWADEARKYDISDVTFPTYEEAKAYVAGFENGWLIDNLSIETRYGRQPLGADIEIIVA